MTTPAESADPVCANCDGMGKLYDQTGMHPGEPPDCPTCNGISKLAPSADPVCGHANCGRALSLHTGEHRYCLSNWDAARPTTLVARGEQTFLAPPAQEDVKPDPFGGLGDGGRSRFVPATNDADEAERRHCFDTVEAFARTMMFWSDHPRIEALTQLLLKERASLRADLAAKEGQLETLRRIASALAGEFDRAVAHAEFVAGGSKGMHVPFHGDFESAARMPSLVGKLRWWSRALHEAIGHGPLAPTGKDGE